MGNFPINAGMNGGFSVPPPEDGVETEHPPRTFDKAFPAHGCPSSNWAKLRDLRTMQEKKNPPVN